MYEFLRGEIATKAATQVVLDVGGVGWRLETSVRTASRLPSTGLTARILVHLRTQEDGSRLFGFADEEERELFRALLAISGVGPSHALALLSQYDPAEVWDLASQGEAKAIARTKGIGPKIAQRVCLELAGRPRRGAGRADLETLTAAGARGSGTPDRPGTALPAAHADATDALVVLGYTEEQAGKALARAADVVAPDASVEDLVRAALRHA